MPIRTASIADAEAIAALITELGYPTSRSSMEERLSALLDEPTHATFVGELETGVVGVAGAMRGRFYERDGVYVRLVLLSVASSARGRGIGRELVAAVEAWAIEHGATDLLVNSAMRRTDAHTFYERQGFERTGFRFVKRIAPIIH